MSVITKEELKRLHEWISILTDAELSEIGRTLLKPCASLRPRDEEMWARLRYLVGDEMNRRTALRDGNE